MMNNVHDSQNMSTASLLLLLHSAENIHLWVLQGPAPTCSTAQCEQMCSHAQHAKAWPLASLCCFIVNISCDSKAASWVTQIGAMLHAACCST
jgi:hypothetical protein